MKVRQKLSIDSWSHSDLIKKQNAPERAQQGPGPGHWIASLSISTSGVKLLLLRGSHDWPNLSAKNKKKNHKTANFLVNICCLLYFQSFFFILNFIFLLYKYLIVLSYKIVFTRYTKRVERLMKGGSIWFHAWFGNA